MTSSSPFLPYANATLTFEVATDNFVEDELGNPTPVKREIVVIALLEPSSPSLDLKEGVNQTRVNMKGYLVSPQILPDSINPPCTAIAQVKTGIGRTETGLFSLLPSIQDPYLVAQNIDLITEISGTFTRTN